MGLGVGALAMVLLDQTCAIILILCEMGCGTSHWLLLEKVVHIGVTVRLSFLNAREICGGTYRVSDQLHAIEEEARILSV